MGKHKKNKPAALQHHTIEREVVTQHIELPDARIVRAAALRAAVDSLGIGADRNTVEVLKRATAFEAWIIEGTLTVAELLQEEPATV